MLVFHLTLNHILSLNMNNDVAVAVCSVPSIPSLPRRCGPPGPPGPSSCSPCLLKPTKAYQNHQSLQNMEIEMARQGHKKNQLMNLGSLKYPLIDKVTLSR